MTEYSDGYARQLEDILDDLSAGRLTVQQAAESIRRQSPQMLHRPVRQRPRSLGVVIATVGVLFMGMAGMIGAQSYQFMTNGVKTQATITDLNLRKGVPRPRYEYVVNDSTYAGVAAVSMPGSRRNHRMTSLTTDLFPQGIAVVSLVTDDIPNPETLKERRGRDQIVPLSSRENQTNSSALAADSGMHFCGQSTARAANRLLLAPPFAPAAC